MPTSAALNFDGRQISLDNIPIRDEAGKERQVIHVVHGLALGQIVIVEAVQGGGGLWILQSYLTQLNRREHGNGHPAVHLVDAVTHDLREVIRRGRGVESVQLGVAQGAAPPNSSFGKALSAIRDKMHGAEEVAVQWSSKGQPIDTSDVLAAYDEAEHFDLFDRVSINLKNGERISLSKYRIQTHVDVGEGLGRNPPAAEVRRALEKYMISLLAVNGGVAIITPHGTLGRGIGAAI